MTGKHLKWIMPAVMSLFLMACAAMDQDARLNFLEGQMKDVLSSSAKWEVTSRDLRTKLADHAARMDNIRNEIQRLSGRLDDMETGVIPKENPIFNQDGVNEEIRSLKERLQYLEAKVRDREKELVPSALTIPESGAPSGKSQVVPLPGNQVTPVPPPTMGREKGVVEQTPQLPPEKKAYHEALELLKNQKYEQAIRRFRKFIKAYPGDELADNAQYWIGEGYYGLKKYDEAIIEFEEVIRQYPKGDKVPAALLKEGLAFHELKDDNTARQILKKVMDQYPKSEESKIALEKVATLK